MALLDDLKKNLEAISMASEKVVKKSGGAVELRKLKMEQESLKKELNNCYAQIGRMVLEKMEGADVPAEMEMLVNQIEDCKEAIAEIEQTIARKRGQRVCPVCGARADKAAVFCQKCGTRLPDLFQEEEKEEASPEPEETAAEEESLETAASDAEAEAAPETAEEMETEVASENESGEKADAPEDTPV